MKKRYDLILPLGNACSCSLTLRKAKLQLLSFPYDWVGPGSVDADVLTDLGNRIENICNDFRDWLRMDDFVYLGDSGPKVHTEYYKHPKMNMLFLHDFPKGMPMEKAFPIVNAKYRRRIQRLQQILSSASRVLILRLDRPDSQITTPIEACQDALKKLGDKYPDKHFEMILLQQADGVKFADRTITCIPPGITRIAFDYHSRSPKALKSDVEVPLTAKAVRALCRVKDYRSSRERWQGRKKSARRIIQKLIKPVARMFANRKR